MSELNNKSGETEVQKDQTGKSEVDSVGKVNSEDVLNDIMTPDPVQVSESEEDKPEKPEEGKSEPEEVEASKGDETKPDESEESEESSKGDPNPSDEKKEEPFAKIGDQSFETKDDLLKFTQSQIGYNTWFTGHVKKRHPEWFGEDGSLKTKELENAIVGASAKIKEATETVAEHKDKDAEELTDEEKDDLKKARAILEPLGVVFKDDPAFKDLNETKQKVESREVQEASIIVKAFQSKHPLSIQHAEKFAEMIEDRGYNDLELAWDVYKIENKIQEDESGEPNEESKSNTNPPKKPMDTAIPAKINKGSGDVPSKREKQDVMDELISDPGLF